MVAPSPAKPPASEPRPLARQTGIFVLVSAVVTLITAVLGTGFGDGSLPPALRYANLGAAAVDLGLGFGIMRKHRAAWAFGVSIFATLTLINLIGAPWMVRGGVAGGIALGLAAARVVAGTMLIASQHEVEKTS